MDKKFQIPTLLLLLILINCDDNCLLTEICNCNYSIVFNRDYDIYIMEHLDSTQIKKITNKKSDFAPKFSPDGKKIAFYSSRGEDTGIYCMNTDTTNLIKLVSLGKFFIVDFAWSPKSNKIAFSHDFGDGARCIYIVNADGSGLRRLSSGRGDLGITWSADGFQIGYSKRDNRRCDAYIINEDGTNEHIFTDAAFSGDIQWSPDGQRIAFVAQFESLKDEPLYMSDIYICDLSGKNMQRLTNYHLTNYKSAYPRWSPDGKKIFFKKMMNIDDIESNDIYVIDLDTYKETRLTYLSRISTFHISPDGEKIIFQWHRYNARFPDSFDFYLINSNGTFLKKILSKANGPEWLPVKTKVN